MPTHPELTQEQREYFSALGHRGVEARRRRRDAVADIVRTTRKAQGLPRTVTDLEVLETVAALIEGAAADGPAA